MLGKIVRYILLVLVVVGVVFLLNTLIDDDGLNKNFKTNNETYTVSIRVMDRESKKFVNGGEFVLKTSDGKTIEQWVSKENIKRIGNLKNGTYTIIQNSAAEGYEISEKVTFKIYNEDKDVVIYNDIKVQEVISNENVLVENTLSMKDSFGYIIALVFIGIGMIFVNKKGCALGK